MYHPRGSCFSGMNSAREHYNLLFLVGVFVCYVEVLDLVSCQGFAEEVAFYSLLLRQILIQHTISVGYTMSKVNHFLSFIKTKSKLNRIQAILTAWARVLV